MCVCVVPVCKKCSEVFSRKSNSGSESWKGSRITVKEDSQFYCEGNKDILVECWEGNVDEIINYKLYV